MTRFTIAFATMAALLATATAAGAEEKKCTLVRATSIQMIRSPTNGFEVVPVKITGKTKYFLLDTGGFETQIARTAAEDLKLAIFTGRQTLMGITGVSSSNAATIPEFDLGTLGRVNVVFPISPDMGNDPNLWFDGSVALDYLEYYDADFDFGSDVLNLFSPDHCPGGVVYWQAPAVAILPIIKGDSKDISVPVTLDGHTFDAVLDTGSSDTSMRLDLAQKLYGLSPGSPDTPPTGALNNDASLQTYSHVFKGLAFGDIAVTNPKVNLYPGKSFYNSPDMTLGMDVLRKLHIYFAFHEGKMYISPASAQTPEQQALQATLQPIAGLRTAHKRLAAAQIAELDKMLATNPDDYKSLNNRCFTRATIKSDLDAALADCDRSLKLKPGEPLDLDSRAFVLYQQGKYQDAVTGYDAALAADPKLAESLFMRGHAKGKLGDAAGMAADIAAAKGIKPDVENQFRAYELDL